MPPTRFRVVERGRRLEVIDTASGQPVTGRPDARGHGETPLLLDRASQLSTTNRKDRAGWLPRATRFDGTATFTTHALYDDKAPRTVKLDPAHARVARWLPVLALALVAVVLAIAVALSWSGAPLLIVLAAVAFNPKLRERLRAATTSLIDRYADPA